MKNSNKFANKRTQFFFIHLLILYLLQELSFDQYNLMQLRLHVYLGISLNQLFILYMPHCLQRKGLFFNAKQNHSQRHFFFSLIQCFNVSEYTFKIMNVDSWLYLLESWTLVWCGMQHFWHILKLLHSQISYSIRYPSQGHS